MITQSQPLVSIGMPVYNGEQHIEAALEALLSQDYPNLELIISDNCSTDRTLAICRDHADRDSRIILHTQDHNRGATWNFRYVLSCSRGEYFMWAAHDDGWEQDFISKCYTGLQDNPDAVVCAAATQLIDPDGDPIDEPLIRPNTANLSTFKQVSHVLRDWHWCAIYGLMRTKTARRVQFLDQLGGDLSVVLQLASLGDIVNSDRTRFYYRYHPTRDVSQTLQLSYGHSGSISLNPWNDLFRAIRCHPCDQEQPPLSRWYARMCIYRLYLTPDWHFGNLVLDEAIRLHYSQYPTAQWSAMVVNVILILSRKPSVLLNLGWWSALLRAISQHQR